MENTLINLLSSQNNRDQLRPSEIRGFPLRSPLNFDQRCSRHEPFVPRRQRSSCDLSFCFSHTHFVLAVNCFDRGNTTLDPVIRHLLPRSLDRGQQFIQYREYQWLLLEITRRKSPHFQTFSSMKRTFSSVLKTEHYLPRILKRFLCSNAAIFKETISQR